MPGELRYKRAGLCYLAPFGILFFIKQKQKSVYTNRKEAIVVGNL